MIPGIGDSFDLVNVAWYLADRDYKNALLSGICALPFVEDLIGTGIDITGVAKAAKFVKTASRAISYAATFTQATGGAVRGMKDVWKNAKDGKFFTKQNAIDMAGVAINTFTALCSGKSAYKYGSETVGMLKTGVADAWSGIKKQASALYNDNGGYLNFGGNESGRFSIPTQQQMHDAVTQWARMEESLADSNIKFNKFNTATVVYDAKTGNYYYGMNRGIQLSGDSLNSSLLLWLRDTTLEKRYRVGNWAEVDAVNQALNFGVNIKDLYMYTINTKDNTPKPMCRNCIYSFVDRVEHIFSKKCIKEKCNGNFKKYFY